MSLRIERLNGCYEKCEYCRSKRPHKVIIWAAIVVIGLAVALVPKVFG